MGSTFVAMVLASASIFGYPLNAACVRQASSDPAVVRLEKKLAASRRALEKAKEKLSRLDQSARLYREARALGVAKAVARSGLTTRQQRRLAVAIVREAHANGLDPLLVVAVIRSESAFDTFAVSGVGALGLMQMMPKTGTWMAQRKGEAIRDAHELFDFELNVELGCAYLARMIDRFGSVSHGLLAYNMGPSAATVVLGHPKTRRRLLRGYPHQVIRRWRRLRRAYARHRARSSTRTRVSIARDL